MSAERGPPLAWRLFRIHPGEGGRVFMFGLLAGLLQMGVALGFTAADALFLTNVGVRGLSVVYLLTPVVMGAYVLVHAYLLGRLGIDRVMTLTLVALALGGCLVWWVLRVSPGPFAYYAAMLFSVLWWIGLYSLFWNWVDGFFDIQDAKRVYSMFSAGEAAGGVAGGGLAVFLAHATSVENLFLVWGVLALLAIPVCAAIRRKHKRLESDWEEDPAAGFRAKVGKTVGALRASPFVLILGAVLVAGLFIITVTEYQYLGILSEGVGEEELAALLGTLVALVSVFNVAVNLFFFNRLVLAVGVRNVALIPAGAYLVAFTLLLLQGGAAAAVVGFFTHHGVLASIEYNNQNFLFNAVPDSVRREARTILEGLAEPMATAVGGAFLLLASTRISPALISTVGLGSAGVYLGLVLLLRRHYGPSLVANLKRRWLDLSRSSEDVLSGLPSDEIVALRAFTTHPDPEMALSALRILWLNDPDAAVGETLRFLRERPGQDRQRVRGLLGRLLDQADPEVARPLVEWIVGHIQELGSGFMEDLGDRGLVPQVEAEQLLDSPDPDVVASAVVVMWRSGQPSVRRQALDALVALLGSDRPLTRAAGVRVLGHLAGDALSQEAARRLDDEPEVREAAAVAVRNTATPGQTELVESVLALLRGPEHMAFTALETLARIGDPGAVDSILRGAGGFTPTVRRVVVRVLDRLGLKGVPQAVAALRDPAMPYEGRVLAARSLSHLAPSQLEALAPEIQEVELARAEEFLRHTQALSPLSGAGASVLRRFYRDQQARLTDYVLEILSVSGRVPDYPMLRRWLRAGTPKERANALETLDQALGRRESARLAPLLVADADGVAPTGSSVDAVLERALRGRLGIGSCAAAAALWERDPDRARDLFARVLPLEPQPILREVILDLLDPSPERGVGPVILIHYLEGMPFFEELPLLELEPMVLASRERSIPSSKHVVRRGTPMTELLVVVDGEVRAGPGGGLSRAGTLLGFDAILSDCRAREDVVSLGCRVASIPASEVEAAAHRNGSVAHALFVLREEVGNGAAA